MTTRPLIGSIAALALATFSAAAHSESPLPLDEVLRRSAERPAAKAGDDRAEAAEQLAVAERRAALLPSLSVDASGQMRSRELTLTTPGATFDVAGSRRLAAQVVLRQPVLDAARLLYRAPAARRDAQAARLFADRERQNLAAGAAQLYFDVLEIDARSAAIESTVASLRGRLAELTTLVAEGRAIDRDRRRLQLALDDANLASDNLGRRREVAALALGHAIGVDTAVEPAPITTLAPGTATTSGPRLDVQALEEKRRAVLDRRAAVSAELIPSVSVDGAWIFDDSLFADQDNFFAVTLNLRWTPLASGTRSARRRALAAEANALARQRTETERRARLEVAAAASDVKSAQAALAVASRGVDDALEARRVTTERYRSGRETVSDLLEVESLVSDRLTAKAVARIAVERARIAERLARGTLL